MMKLDTEEERQSPKKPIDPIYLVAAIAFFDGISETFNQITEPAEIFKFHVTWIIKTYSTILTLKYFMYRALTTIPWGFFIDKHGRKQGVLISLLSVSTILLISPIFDWYFFYALQRLLNGLFLITRVLSTEVCSDDKKHWSISITFFSWIFGFICGPFLSYILPESKFFGNFLMACFGYALLYMVHKHLDETLGEDKNKYQVIEQGYDVYRHASLYTDLELEFENSIGDDKPDSKGNELLTEIQDSTEHFEVQMLPAFNSANVFRLYYIYAMNALYGCVLGSLLTPWYHNTKVQSDIQQIESDEQWPVFSRFLVPLSVCSLVIYPIIQQKKSDSFILLLGHWLIAGVFALLPFGESITLTNYFGLAYWIWILLAIRLVANQMTFCSIQRYVNDIHSSEKRGNITAMFLTVFYAVIYVVPLLSDEIFVWSKEGEELSITNYWIAFMMMVVLTLFGLRVINKLELVKSRQSANEGGATEGLQN